MQTVEERVEELLGRMTLEEKIGQLNQTGTTMVCALPGIEADIESWVTEMLEGRMSQEEFGRLMAMCEEDLKLEQVEAGAIGAFVNLYDDEKVRLVKEAAARSRLGIPVYIGVDVIRGYRTMFPTPLALSCSWDMEQYRKMAAVAKKEALISGVNWIFGPMLDVARDGRWGRIVESPGEDPYLAGQIAETMVKAFQQEDENGCILATAKHFLAYGAVSGGQDYNTVSLSKQQLYDTYLPPFRAAVKAGVGAVMSAFHDLNGVPCTCDRWLLTDILRGELGFEGFVVSDAEGVKQCVPHGVACDEKDAARLSLLAGSDMDMSSLDYSRYLAELVCEGSVKEEDIDRAVRRILKQKFAFSLFDTPYVYDPEKIAGTVLCKEHRNAAKEVAERSVVLLKNDGILPIASDRKKILVVGEFARSREALMGPWALSGDKETTVTIVEGLSACAPEGTTVEFVKGYDISDDESGFEEALERAKTADMVIAVAGETAFMSGEAASRTKLDLVGAQERLLHKLAKLGVPLAVVLVNGRPLTISRLQNNPGIGAIVESWHLGCESGNALAEILFGIYNPSGKLTVTFPNEAGQEPMYYNHPNTGKPGGDFKFTSKYQDAPILPLYPFGYGLSYTTYEYGDLQLLKKALSTTDTLCCSCKVKNTGSRFGEEIVQLYIHDHTASLSRPVKELKAYEKISLEAGEEKTVTLHVPVQEMGFYDRDGRYVIEPGRFSVYVGPNSQSGLQAEFLVK